MGFTRRLLLALVAIHLVLRIRDQQLHARVQKRKVLQKKRTVLVTGGAGFLGTHVCRRFVENGYDVKAVDIGLPHVTRKVNSVEYIRMNLVTCSEQDLTKAMDGCCAVVHTAGVVALYSVPELLHNIHVFATAKVLAIASESAHVRAVVHASSTGVVHNGLKNVQGMSHDAPYSNPHLSGYSKTKYKAEVITKLANCIDGVLTTCLRLPGIMGYGDGMAVTQMLDNDVHILPTKATTIIEMLYVKNAAEAFVCGVDTLIRESNDEEYRNRSGHANGNAFFVTNSGKSPEQVSAVEFWRDGRQRLGIVKPLTLIPEPASWMLAYSIEFVYWYLQGYVPATRTSIWNLNSKSILFMMNDNTFSGQKEVRTGIGYRPIFGTKESFDDIREEYERCKTFNSLPGKTQ